LRGWAILLILLPVRPTQTAKYSDKERSMKNPLDSLWGTVIAGLVLTAVLVFFARNFLG